MNAYFQLDNTPRGTYLTIFRETDGGDKININELAEYLTQRNISFDIADLNKRINAISKIGAVQLDIAIRYPESESLSVKISEDKMTAVCRFYPPSTDGMLMNFDDVISDLKRLKIVYGIDNEEIERFISDKKYCTDYIVAKGKPPVHGSDASIEYFFNTDLRAKPTLKEDGSVDFFNLNSMNHIKSGDLLAKLTKEDPGVAGINVLNEVVKPREVKRLSLKFGRNVRLDETQTMAYSEVNGHVTLVDDKIFVSNLYEVENVDASTGNIDYDGSVKINGNINSNFSVKAKGDIEVMGVVEGATLVADGNISVARGINGMGKGYVRAGGNIIVKYVENATLISGGFIQSEAIMHSNASAKNEVIVEGRKGNIAGSYVSARESITVKNLGSQMGSDTTVQLGIDPSMKIRLEELKKELETLNKNLAQLIPVVDAFKKKVTKGISIDSEQLENFKNMTKLASSLLEKREDVLFEIDDINDSLDAETFSQLIVKEIAYAGTKVCINDVSLTLKSDFKFCRFIKENGEVKMASM